MEITDILRALSPFPLVDERGVFADGYLFQQPSYCIKKCKSHDCIDLDKDQFTHYTCSYGFSCYRFSFSNTKFIINGMLIPEHNRELRGQKRKIYKSNKIKEAAVSHFRGVLASLQKYVTYLSSLGIKDNISVFHDIKTSLGLVMNSAQSIVDLAPGENFETKLENADHEARNLFLSASLLNDQLALVDIIVNPERISYGRKRRTAIYKLFHKIGRLFIDKAAKRHIEINIAGSSYYQVYAYESIQFLPLILIDNAVKYSLEGKKVFIQIDDNKRTNAVDVTVSSYGPIVQPKYADHIFDKYFRGDNASFFSSQGNGLGLFLAQEIAGAHGFIIVYSSDFSKDRMGMPMGKSDFSFSIPCDKHEMSSK